jgi:hypothetical protein
LIGAGGTASQADSASSILVTRSNQGFPGQAWRVGSMAKIELKRRSSVVPVTCPNDSGIGEF